MPTMSAMAIIAAIRPYSMAVAPRLSRSSLLNGWLPNIECPPGRMVRREDFSHCSANERLMRKVYMANSPTIVLVVAAAIRDPAGRLLLQQCPPGKRHAGLWEFPG